MLDFVFCCSLFTMGIIAACVDWRELTNKMFKFDNYVRENDQFVENTFNPKIILLILFILIVFFFVVIYLPAKILFEHLEGKFFKSILILIFTSMIDKYTPIIARFGLKRITYRKEMKRRGSWPLAYSN